MNKQEIIEGDILIGAFDGLREGTAEFHCKSDGTYKCYYDDAGRHNDSRTAYSDYELKYHSSWDWLMPVVEKIIYSATTDEGERLGINIQRELSYAKIIPTYKAVIEFIKWYNLNNKR